MEKIKFLNALHAMRSRKGNFMLCNDICNDIKNHLELVDVVINDLSINICEYLAGKTSDEIMCAEYSLYCFQKILELRPEKKRAVFKILKEMTVVKIIYTGSASAICVKVMNEIGQKYSVTPELLTEFTEILDLLRKNNPWVDNYIK